MDVPDDIQRATLRGATAHQYAGSHSACASRPSAESFSVKKPADRDELDIDRSPGTPEGPDRLVGH